MTEAKRELHLGLMFWGTGTHPSGWRWPTAKADAAYDIEYLQQVTQLVEKAKFDFLFLGDKLASEPGLQTTNPAQMSRLEPFAAGASLAAATSEIGIVVTANPTYYDPFTLARLFASLDHLSQGRASWNIVTGADPHAAANFSRDAHWDAEQRYDWADEFVGIVKDLWDSWEDGAWDPDASAGQAFDPNKVHALNHKGQHFTVAGPLDAPRPPQGHPIILHAGTSDRSRELGARGADAIFTSHATIESAQAYYRDIKDRAHKYGRSDADIAILPSLTPIIAPTTAEAVAIYDQLNSYLTLDPEDKPEGPGAFGGRGGAKNRNLTTASKAFGVDLLGNDHDAPVPPSVLAAASDEGKRLFAEITRLTRRTVDGPQHITYRDLIIGASRGTSTVVGNPEEVADYIEAWFTEGAADGFNIFPAYVAGAVEAFVDLVVPVLQARGIYRTEYAGPTFRHHLGLERPENRLLARARAAAARKTAV